MKKIREILPEAPAPRSNRLSHRSQRLRRLTVDDLQHAGVAGADGATNPRSTILCRTNTGGIYD